MSEDLQLTPKDYQNAIDVQTACNLGAVVHSFSRVIKKIQHNARKRGHGTDWINSHPIVKLYTEHLNYLSRGIGYIQAYKVCETKAEEE